MQLAAKNFGRSASLTAAAPERVYLDLREQIINFDLPPGTTLSRTELAKAFGVSQTPVREALQRLEKEGLVLIYPQSKTIVAKIDVRQLSETQFLRVSVETEVVRRLAANDRQDTLRRAQTLLDMQKTLVGSDEGMPMFTELDRSFHQSLFEGVGMENLYVMLLERLGHLYRCQWLELPREGKMQDIIEAHQAVLTGIAKRDPERAARAMNAHLSGTISRVESLRKEFPDYFTDDEFRWGVS